MPVFAFTDMEGSTGLWEKYQDAMGPVIAKHYAILDKVVPAFGGKIIKKTGDGIFALFPDETPDRPSPALECALDLQRRFQDENWPVIGELRVRMAFHCGQAEEMAGDYYGPTANRTARFMSLGWGGQILVSEDLRRVAQLPEGAEWKDLGFHQVKDLPEPQHIFCMDHPSLRLREFPALKSLSNRPHNMPGQLSPLVGRKRELADIAGLLSGPHSRLVTLLGGGGMGKTRLAIQAALDNLEAFKHGANLVSLDTLAAPDQLATRIAESLKIGLYRQKEPREQLLEYLKDKGLLLILDPCERLGVAAALISDILESCPGVRVLACSRKRLNLRSESVLELRGLDYPADAVAEGFASSGCARLFVQQVQGSQQGYVLRPDDRPPFLQICRLLRGMPLGLELAADWIRSTPMKALAERLEKEPGFLASARQDLPESHRSLKALFDSAWVQLSDAECVALSKVSAFKGGFSLGAAQLAFMVRAETLATLAERSLIEILEPGRYLMPEGTRAFAAAKLTRIRPNGTKCWTCMPATIAASSRNASATSWAMTRPAPSPSCARNCPTS
jgi:class 3 adenylate cyclase